MDISIVIPCRNEKKHIEKCIRDIYGNTIVQHKAIEVLVVDGMSDDGTLQVLATLQKEFPSLKIVTNEKKVTPVAFNLGIKNASGKYLQIIGARQFISNDYLEKAYDKFESDPEIWCIGGLVENYYEDETSRVISQAMGSSFGVGVGNFRVAKESQYVDTVGTPMYPMSVFDKVGYFDESLVRNQDDEFNYRVTEAGGKILLFAEISLSYVVRAELKKLFRQYRQYGYWKVFVNKKHNTVTSIRQLIPLFFVVFMLSYPVWWGIGISTLYVMVLALYSFLALFFAHKASDRFQDIPKVAFTFFILHFSYGLGYLEGIIDFLILGKKPTQQHQQLSR